MKYSLITAALLGFALMPIGAEEAIVEPAQVIDPTQPVAESTQPAQVKDFLKKLDLEGITINAEEKYVDVEAEVCLDEGWLELVACTHESKEHESIIKVFAEPVKIHLALLLVGAKNGKPARQKLIQDGEHERIVYLPAYGQPVHVSLVISENVDESVETPIADFIRHEKNEGAMAQGPQDSDQSSEQNKFPTSTFLFLGSHLIPSKDAPPRYIAGESGNVISISTFGDEMLGLEEAFGHSNDALAWVVNSDLIPEVGTSVTLRLRPVFDK